MPAFRWRYRRQFSFRQDFIRAQSVEIVKVKSFLWIFCHKMEIYDKCTKEGWGQGGRGRAGKGGVGECG
ncbi:hypothetical protein D3Z51_15995 [Clostridiaceae bacterium]|nr:hypothetical protein [Clostridiaceae bacterium]RKI10577.1 hypothetical protein D7V81_15460 [bacterium 1XD21-70]